MITTAAKKISQMSPMELAEEAKKSQADAEKVANVASNSSAGVANSTFFFLSQIPHAVQSRIVRRFVLNRVLREGLAGAKYETFINFMNTTPQEEEAGVLLAITINRPVAVAILLLAKGTPTSVTDSLLMSYGFTGKPMAEETARRARHSIDQSIASVFKETKTWGNDRSAMFLGQRLTDGTFGDPTQLIAEAEHISPFLASAILSHGTQEQKEALKSSKDVNIRASIVLEDLLKAFPTIPVTDDLMYTIEDILYSKEVDQTTKSDIVKNFIQKCPSEDDKDRIGMIIARSNSEELYMAALDMFEKGLISTPFAVTSNLTFALKNKDRVLNALKSRGLLYRAHPKFIDAIGDDISQWQIGGPK